MKVVQKYNSIMHESVQVWLVCSCQYQDNCYMHSFFQLVCSINSSLARVLMSSVRATAHTSITIFSPISCEILVVQLREMEEIWQAWSKWWRACDPPVLVYVTSPNKKSAFPASHVCLGAFGDLWQRGWCILSFVSCACLLGVSLAYPGIPRS